MSTPNSSTAQNEVDPDLFDPPPRRNRYAEQAPIVAIVAVGGAIGACARYGAGLIWPTTPGAFPVTTLGINALGCAIMGAFMVLITEIWTTHRLVRPFVGTGILGGFTTFSTYATDVTDLINDGHAAAGILLLSATPLAALAAVWTAAAFTHCLATRRNP
ncbi:CrcB family protein [Nocardia sp. 2]|uniref:Fluoride-specific ion channel FluC n=1 Tax=Nocardia acididurans TaxID=2802282 RepID=A0ABS1MHZ7_9NOCA|nr:CrcB family protein [Nocardia acididurans]MBL1080186.1 CrcB family protein [Nocardia acididurans]